MLMREPSIDPEREGQPGSPPRIKQTLRESHLDMFIGVLGFMAFVALAFTVTAEIQGENALAEALISLLLVLLVYGAWRLRGRV